MNRDAIEYLKYIEDTDSFFYKNFQDYIVFANDINRKLKDEEYNDLKNATKSQYKIKLKDKRTSVNIIKNFFFKISPTIIKQIDYDVSNDNIIFKSKEEMDGSFSETIVNGDNYHIEIADSGKIEECFLLTREYAHLFVGNLMKAIGVEKGLKKVYTEAITSLTELALAKHLSTNPTLSNDSRIYIYKKIYNSIYDMNDSYLTLMYLGYLFENKSHSEMVKLLGSEEILDRLEKSVKEKKSLNDYIHNLGMMIAIKQANNTDDIYALVNTYYIKATSEDMNYIKNNLKIDLDSNQAVEEITHYIRNSK